MSVHTLPAVAKTAAGLYESAVYAAEIYTGLIIQSIIAAHQDHRPAVDAFRGKLAAYITSDLDAPDADTDAAGEPLAYVSQFYGGAVHTAAAEVGLTPWEIPGMVRLVVTHRTVALEVDTPGLGKQTATLFDVMGRPLAQLTVGG